MNWEADDAFGSPPRGPRDRDHYPPRVYDDVGFFGPDTLHPVEAGPADSYRVRNSEFELRTDFAGDWPGVCTFSIDDSGGWSKGTRCLVKRENKNGFNTEERLERPWGFLISKETRAEQNANAYGPAFGPASRHREWWTIKAVLQTQQDARFVDTNKYSKYTQDLWSAPLKAASREKTEAFAEWAQSRGFETVCDFC